MLGDFLKAVGERPTWNCSTDPSDWCVLLGHPDFAAKWRHVTDVEACDVPESLLALWERDIGDGLPIVEAPYQAGDIAVVSINGFEGGAIYTGDKWAIRRQRGYAFLPGASMSILKVWRP